MATIELTPRLDTAVHTDWNPYTYTNIDGGSGGYSDGTSIKTVESANAYAEHLYDAAPSDTDVVSSIRFYVRCKRLGTPATCDGEIYIAGAWKGEKTYTLQTDFTTYSQVWTGSWTKAQVDAMKFRIEGTNGDKSQVQVSAIWCVITYTIIPTYDKVINGVSSYSHINGVAVADITAWNGVT